MALRAGSMTSTSIDLAGFDYVREVHGASASLEEDGAEWLAVLVRLRATGRRELLAIYDPGGNLAYQELLERETPLLDTPVLWAARDQSARRAFIVDVGTRLRYQAWPKHDRRLAK